MHDQFFRQFFILISLISVWSVFIILGIQFLLLIHIHEPLVPVKLPKALLISKFGPISNLRHNAVSSLIKFEVVRVHLMVERTDKRTREFSIKKYIHFNIFMLILVVKHLVLEIFIGEVIRPFLLAIEDGMNDFLALEPSIGDILAVVLGSEQFLELLGRVKESEAFVEGVLVLETV